MSKSSESKACGCLPYYDKCLMASQGMALLAFILSFCLPWDFLFDNVGLKVILFLLGFGAFILLQIVWCCKMSKCGLLTAGVLAMLSGILDVVGGIPYATSTKYCDDDGQDSCSYSIAISFVTAIFWFGCTGCNFAFACVLRTKKDFCFRSRKGQRRCDGCSKNHAGLFLRESQVHCG